MKHFDQESGVTYILAMTLLGFGACAFILIVMSPITAYFANFANGLIGNSSLYYPAEAQGTVGFILAMGALSPIVLIFGTVAGAYLDSVVEKERIGGGYL